MIIYAVDDEPLALRLLESSVRAVVPHAELTCFSHPDELLDAARKQPADVVFLDVRMYDITGVEVARRLNEFQGARNIVFVTGYDSYAKDAFDVFASGYVLKPVCEDDIRVQLDHLRSPLEEVRETCCIHVRTLGVFDVFVADEPVVFKRSKSKEILAYLVLKNGARVSIEQLEQVLWETGSHLNDRRGYVSVLLSDLRKSLASAGAEDMLRHAQGGLSVDPSAFSCDYYQLLQGDAELRHLYNGEFMSQYSWAKPMADSLKRLVKE